MKNQNEGTIMDGFYRLTQEQVKQIMERGYTYVLIDKKIQKINKNDLCFSKEEIDNFAASFENKEMLEDGKKNI